MNPDSEITATTTTEVILKVIPAAVRYQAYLIKKSRPFQMGVQAMVNEINAIMDEAYGKNDNYVVISMPTLGGRVLPQFKKLGISQYDEVYGAVISFYELNGYRVDEGIRLQYIIKW
jgi:hypothetical protein